MTRLLLLALTFWANTFLFSKNENAIGDSLANLEGYFSKNKIEPKKSRDGLFFTIQKEGSGQFSRPGSFVKIRYTGRLLNEKVFDATTTGERDEPFVFQIGFRQVVPGLDLAVSMLKPGGKGTFYLPNSLAYGNLPVGKSIPAGAALVFEVELMEILTTEAYEKWAAEQEERDRKAFEKKQAEQFAADQVLLDEHARAKKWSPEKLPSGLHYFVPKNGKGEKPRPGQRVAVEYEGFLLDGTPFDASKKGAPFEFTIGNEEVIAGWDEGLQKFGAGSEGWLLIPSKLGYGPMAIEEEGIRLPANACLVFKVKLLKID